MVFKGFDLVTTKGNLMIQIDDECSRQVLFFYKKLL